MKIFTILTIVMLFTFQIREEYSKALPKVILLNNLDTIPIIYAEDVVSTEYAEFGISISPNGEELYFTRRGSMPDPRNGKIMVAKILNGNISKPQVASFSGEYNDMEPLITPDGKKIIFGSNRPMEGEDIGKFRQWYVERTETGWSAAQIFEPLNNIGFVMYPTVSNSGNVYFTGEDGIYVLYHKNDNYLEPKKLTGEINSLPRTAHPYISPDESYLIFDAQPRGNMKSDLFISYNINGEWTKPKQLGNNINSSESNAIAFITYDKKYFFFVRSGDIYWIETKYLSNLK